MTELIHNQWEKFLCAQSLRLTPQRHAILEQALLFSEPFTAEDVTQKTRSLEPIISRATLYRTLQLLVQANILREIDAGKDYKYYAFQAQTKNFQAQIICNDCNKIYEMDAPFMSWYSESAANKLHMKALSARLQIIAECTKDCHNTPHENRSSI